MRDNKNFDNNFVWLYLKSKQFFFQRKIKFYYKKTHTFLVFFGLISFVSELLMKLCLIQWEIQWDSLKVFEKGKILIMG